MKRAGGVLAVALLSTSPASAQLVLEMTPELVRQAIADDKNPGCYSLKTGYACFSTPYSRLAAAAREARKRYEKFAEADVTPELLRPGIVEVIAWAQPSFVYGRGRTGPPIDVTTVVVAPKKSSDRSAAILPAERVDLDERYQNLMGAKWEAHGLVARFPITVLVEANEVRVVYAGKGCADWKQKLASECGFQFKLDGVR